MIHAGICTNCLQRYEVTVLPNEQELFDSFVKDGECKCPRLCGGQVVLGSLVEIAKLSEGKQLKDPVALSATQLFQAVHGAGLPDELPKDVDALDSLLRTHSVVEAKWEQVGSRIYLHEMTLSNGVVFHLAAGGRGAQVLKVTRAA